MREQLNRFCRYYGLGDIAEDPQQVSGGLLHKMYHVTTGQGEYAVKVLDPHIMQRPIALQNMINSELVAHKLKESVPLVASIRFNDKSILAFEEAWFIVFDWLDGASIFPPEITTDHCRQIGHVLGKIHTADIKLVSLPKTDSFRAVYDWESFACEMEMRNTACVAVLKENLEKFKVWDNDVVKAWPEIRKHRVISHCDLDPKNVMWKNGIPYVIDWEAAGYVNPAQELLDVIKYWTVDEDGSYSKVKFDALTDAYSQYVDLKNTNWNAVLASSFDSMLGWLEFNLKKVLGIEAVSAGEQRAGAQQVYQTIAELNRYAAQTEQLLAWLSD